MDHVDHAGPSYGRWVLMGIVAFGNIYEVRGKMTEWTIVRDC